MIRHLAFASLGFVLAATAFAESKPETVDPGQEPARENTAAGLDAFVETAIRNGLLVPNIEPAPSEPAAPVVIETPIVTAEPVAPTVYAECGRTYPLDFSVVKSLRRMTELSGPDGDQSADAAMADKVRNLKSKLALGLYSEANAMIAVAPEETWQPYRKFAALMSARGKPDVAYFRHLADCHAEADIWLAVAELRVYEPQGITRLKAQIEQVRSLPHNLRTDVAAITVPALILLRHQETAQEIVATFSTSEIENSTQLIALKTAISDMPDGSESDDRLVMLLNRPKLKLAALLILIERSETLRPTLKEFVLEEAWAVLEETDTTHGLDRILAFVMRNMDFADLEKGMQRVQTLSVAQADEVRVAIDGSILQSLKANVRQDTPQQAMNSLRALSDFHATLPYTEDGIALRRSGAEMALDLGLSSLVGVMLDQLERDDDVVEMLAEAAFWGGASDDLFDLRAAFPDLAGVNRLAGIRAVQLSQNTIAAAAFTRLTGQPDAQLELLEQGALVNNWALFDAHAASLSENLNQDGSIRLERVRRVRVASAGSLNRNRAPIRAYQIAPLLDATRLALSPRQAGASYE